MVPIDSDILKQYISVFRTLEEYDKKLLSKPSGTKAIYQLTIGDARDVVSQMQKLCAGDLWGKENNNDLEACVSAIYQTFDGVDLYPSMEEKAAILLYLVIKNHPFIDGNKRFAVGLFVSFLHKNGYHMNTLDMKALEFMTLWIAESRPDDMDQVINMIMSCLVEVQKNFRTRSQ
ncbi:hypothetical protein FACS1894198_0850 [Clostridia bacterium]|nr:hypothetical protein FACS1894198_0850 [Clostridia bacterium]